MPGGQVIKLPLAVPDLYNGLKEEFLGTKTIAQNVAFCATGLCMEIGKDEGSISLPFEWNLESEQERKVAIEICSDILKEVMDTNMCSDVEEEELLAEAISTGLVSSSNVVLPSAAGMEAGVEINASLFRSVKIDTSDIKVGGENVPKPIKNWSQCGVSSKILHLLKEYKYEKPTPIQAQAIPVCMSGRDMMGIARTGSGKTLAFLLPLFRHISEQEPADEGNSPIAIIMTATRELCQHIRKECRKFVTAINAGDEQTAELKSGAKIIVCTPDNFKVTDLRRISYLVLDEVDRMFEMGFEPQVRMLVDNARAERQTVMFSATFSRQLQEFARRVLVNPVNILVVGTQQATEDEKYQEPAVGLQVRKILD